MSNKTKGTLYCKLPYYELKVGDKMNIVEYVETRIDTCNYYKVTPIGSIKIHYMFTAEVEEEIYDETD